MEIVVAVICLAIGVVIGRQTKRHRSADEEAQSLHDARQSLLHNPANTEPGDPRSGRPPEGYGWQ
jgi:hypothetical protein